MKQLWRILRVLLPILAVLITLLLVVLASPQANRALLRYASEYVPGLTIGNINGSLLSGLSLSSVDYKTADMHVAARDLTVDMSWSCLLRSQICMRQIAVKRLDVQWHPIASSKSQSSHSSSAAWLPPWPIFLQGVDLQQVHLMIADERLAWRQLKLQAQWHRDQIQVQRFVMDHWSYQTASTSSAEKKVPMNVSVSNAPASSTSIHLTQSLTTALVKLNIPYRIDIRKLVATAGTLDLATPLKVANFQLTGQVSPEQLNVVALKLDTDQGQVDGALTLGLKAPFHSQFHLNVQRQKLGKLQLSGQGPATALKINAAYQGDGDAQLKGQLNWHNPTLPFQLELHAQSQAARLAPVQQISGALQLQGSLLGYQGQLSAKLQAKQQQLNVQGQFVGDQSQLQHFQLQLTSPTGQLNANGMFSWQSTLALQTTINAQKLDLSTWVGLSLPQINGKLTATLAQSLWSISGSDLHGQWQNQPWKLQLKAHGQNRQVDRINVQAQLGQNQLDVSGSITQSLQLKASLAFNQLKQLPWFSAGTLHGELSLSGSTEQPQLSWQLAAQKLHLQEQPIMMGSLQSQGEMLLSSALRGHFNLTIQDGRYGAQSPVNLSADYRGNEQQQLHLKAEQAKRNMQVTLIGQGSLKHWSGQLQQLSIDSELGRLTQAHPTTLSIEQTHLTLAPICLRDSQQGKLCLTEPTLISPAQGQLTGKLDGFALQPLISLWFQSVRWQATLNGKFNVHWQVGQRPQGRLALQVSPGSVVITNSNQQSQQYHYQTLRLNAQARAGDAQFELLSQSKQLGDLTAQLQADLQHGAPYPLQGQLRVKQLQLAPYAPLVKSLTLLQGSIDGQLRIAGVSRHPTINGELKLRHGALEGPQLPLPVADLNSDIQIQGQSAKLTGQFQSAGHLASWQGRIGWAGGALSADVKLSGDKLPVHYPPADLEVSPQLRVRFNQMQLSIDGTVKVDKGQIKVAKLPTSATSLSTDVHIVDQPKTAPVGQALAINVDLNLGNALYLNAFGLTSQLTGKLNVNQRPGQTMQTTGQINLQDGQFIAYGQYLQIQSGSLTFSGETATPIINIKAIRDPSQTTDNVTVGVTAVGTPKHLTVKLFSNPLMAQSEQLSYLLRGHGISSQGDSSVLTSLLLSTGLNQTGELVTKLGNTIGIKQLSLSTSGSGDNAQVQVSGYLFPGVQVKYGRGMFAASNELTLRYQLIPKFYLEVVSGLDNALDLYYEFNLQ
ncbi:autotransporter assembly complex protein TamB [Celerinatantimonas yamalensis]|uniref:Translocation/assembly module TamB domain-containing protein n=1 Tax=Celerinatantimonas yamalensis TaxID=559956 RepID=A0ABW9G3L5_9GAMM